MRRFWVIGLSAVALVAAAVLVVRLSDTGSAPAASAATDSTVAAVTPSSTRATTTQTTTPADWVSPAALRTAVARVQRGTGAQVGVTVAALGTGPTVSAADLQSGTAWSTMKIPVILARYRLAESGGESTGDLLARATAAVTESDNAAVLSLFDDIVARLGGVAAASRYVQQGLRAAGDHRTVVNTVPPAGGFSTFGQTQWALTDGVRFFRSLADACLSPADASRELLKLMGEITPSQRWGLGQAPFAGAGVRFKGGWGPDPSGRYLVRQFGIITAPNGRGIVVGLIDKPADGSFADGVSVLSRLADAVAHAVDPAVAPPATPCGASAAPGPTSAAASRSAARTPATATQPLAGRTVTVDPGHDGGNFDDPAAINRLVFDGNGYKPCNTTGTAAPDGYREADFNWDVALRLRRVLRAAGARVVMTRSSNTGVGPCVDQRAAIGNRAGSSAVVSIHADGGPPGGSGFAVLVPAAIPSGANDAILAPSHRLGLDVRSALLGIDLHTSTYDGHDGIAPRTDLGGLNLSRVPVVLVEVANMQNRADESPMQTPAYRERVAHALADGLERFLTR